MIAVCSLVQNEADIIECWVRHHLAEGVEHLYIADGMSTDGTRDILQNLALETGQVSWFDDPEPICHQAAWMTKLAHIAGAVGAEWIIPADADEFWIAMSGETLADELEHCPFHKLYAPVYHHVDWDYCHIVPKLPKVAFRYNPGVALWMGNHDVDGVRGGGHGVLEVHELQYRGLEHFRDKARARARTLDPAEAAKGQAAHITALAGLDDEQLEQAWADLLAKPTIYDPIRTRTDARPREYGRSAAGAP
jgi:Glycosyl transferase family 2